MGISTRRRKRLKQPPGSGMLGGARDRRTLGIRSCGASDEIILRSEPATAEFTAKQRSSEAALVISRTVDRAFGKPMSSFLQEGDIPCIP